MLMTISTNKNLYVYKFKTKHYSLVLMTDDNIDKKQKRLLKIYINLERKTSIKGWLDETLADLMANLLTCILLN